MCCCKMFDVSYKDIIEGRMQNSLLLLIKKYGSDIS